MSIAYYAIIYPLNIIRLLSYFRSNTNASGDISKHAPYQCRHRGDRAAGSQQIEFFYGFRLPRQAENFMCNEPVKSAGS